MNATYLAYGDEVGFLIDPTRPRSGRDKGKVERRLRDVVGPIVRKGERFVTIDDLNQAASERVLARAKNLINPITGDSVYDTCAHPLPNARPRHARIEPELTPTCKPGRLNKPPQDSLQIVIKNCGTWVQAAATA